MEKRKGRPPKNGVFEIDGAVMNKSWEEVARALLEGDVPVKDIAKRANISHDMVYRYLKDEGFNEYLDDMIAEEMRQSKAAIWRKLKFMCESGDLAAMKLYFELSSREKKEAPPTEGVSIIDDVPNISANEIERLYGTLAGEVL